MKMGEIRQLYPDMKDSLDEGVFFEFKKYYQEHQEDILQALIQDRQKTIVTHTGQEILCTLQQFHGKEYTTNSYGHEYHILLEGKDRGRFGCHVEHRIRPVT